MTASMLLMSALMLISCGSGDDADMNAEFYVTLDKNVIQSNGTDVVKLTATLGGKDVTSGTSFFLSEGASATPIEGNVFSTDETGEYSIIASYQTFYTQDPVVVTAIDMPVPQAAADENPSGTSFVHRAFLTQYTGTGCGYCPGMIRAIRSAFEDEETKEMAVLAAVHSYGAGDPAYIAGPRATSYPYLEIDMAQGFTYDMDPYADGGVLKKALQERTSTPAKVGISANPSYKDGMLVVTVAVKAAEAGDYSLGVWFLQDNVYGQQKDEIGFTAGDSSYSYHDNCVRRADSRYLNTYAGYPLGTVKAGETVERTFVLTVKENAWKLKDMDNIHFAAFVTKPVGKGYEVVNVVDCDYDEPTPFEYK